MVFLIGDDAQEFKILVPVVLVPVRGTFGDKDHIPSADLEGLTGDVHQGAAAQHVLLVLNRVGMTGHTPAALNDEAPHGKVGPLRGGDKHLDGGLIARFHRFRWNITGMLHVQGASYYAC